MIGLRPSSHIVLNEAAHRFHPFKFHFVVHLHPNQDGNRVIYVHLHVERLVRGQRPSAFASVTHQFDFYVGERRDDARLSRVRKASYLRIVGNAGL